MFGLACSYFLKKMSFLKQKSSYTFTLPKTRKEWVFVIGSFFLAVFILAFIFYNYDKNNNYCVSIFGRQSYFNSSRYAPNECVCNDGYWLSEETVQCVSFEEICKENGIEALKVEEGLHKNYARYLSCYSKEGDMVVVEGDTEDGKYPYYFR